jgi:hypothetical protein
MVRRPENPSDYFEDLIRRDQEPEVIDLSHEELLARQARSELARYLEFPRVVERLFTRRIHPLLDLASENSEHDFFSMAFPESFRMFSHPRRIRPSKKDLQKRITVLRPSKEQLDNTCAICLCGYKTSQRASELPCKHMFHRACLNPWLKEADSCPVCRQPIIEGAV